MEFSMQEHGFGFSTKTDFGVLEISSNDEYGFRPYQLLVSSVAVCSGGVLKKIIEKRRQTVNDIQIKADVKRSGEGADEIQEIHLHFLIDAQGISDEQMKKNMELTRKNCSMVQSVKDSIKVTETYEWK
ncbi:Uncharacterized OsmC-related protein [Alteribacillus persepolensis]|uniref:Uncharacterized OsmC-related protein n=1 Tax=Alteribacillus persepolensis TaxID=568899 RepID=A0A1G8CAV1_9BACI|nr:OsmC family protein [Alteribacillus persepolensis]SDH42611.1 Uncharacterized OsmC-related protein [Alteribacillus persepolensis]